MHVNSNLIETQLATTLYIKLQYYTETVDLNLIKTPIYHKHSIYMYKFTLAFNKH